MDSDTAENQHLNETDKGAKYETEELTVHQESLDDAIDDQEFDIPPVQNLPTLESILNAPDDDDLRPQQNFLSELNSLAQVCSIIHLI